MGAFENSTIRLVDGLVDGVLGGLFGGGVDNTGELINLISQSNQSNINSLRALMEQNVKSLNDGMKFFTEFMQITKARKSKKNTRIKK